MHYLFISYRTAKLNLNTSLKYKDKILRIPKTCRYFLIYFIIILIPPHVRN